MIERKMKNKTGKRIRVGREGGMLKKVATFDGALSQHFSSVYQCLGKEPGKRCVWVILVVPTKEEKNLHGNLNGCKAEGGRSQALTRASVTPAILRLR